MTTRIDLDWVEAMKRIINKKIKWVELQPMSKPGENYASILSRATLAYRDDEKGTDGKMDVVLKAPIKHSNPQVEASLHQYLQNEIMMYKEVFEVYTVLLKEKQMFEKIWPQCYFLNSSNILVLEDLKASGYELPRELGKMSSQHVLLVLEALGRLHALSVVAMERGLLHPKDDSRFGLFFTEKDLGDNFVQTGMQSVADAINQTWPPEWKPVSEKLMSIRKRIMAELRRLESVETRVKVINHGDPWCRNILFKYENNVPTSVKFVDYQNPLFNSFGFELAHFMTASCVTPDEYTNDSKYLTTYCNSFQDCLTQFGLDTKLGPTVDEALAELNRLKIFRLVVFCTVTPLAMFESDVPVSMDDIMVLDKNHQRNIYNAYSNQEFAQIFQNMWKYYESIE